MARLSYACFCSTILTIHLLCDENSLDNFQKAEKRFQKRWEAFGGNSMNFVPWKSTWNKEEVEKDFNVMMNKRWSLYFKNPEERHNKSAILERNEAYALSLDTLKAQRSRYPYPSSCDYNVAARDYDASLISISGLHFLAMQAPSKLNVDAFFNLLDVYKVTHLVRLVPAYENNKEACFPYWEGCLDIDPRDGRTSLKTKQNCIHYFPMDLWENHEGIDIPKLYALIRALMQSPEKEKVIAVHCHGGVGRTGTCIAAYVLAQSIESQWAQNIPKDRLGVYIDKTVWELSLQRPFAIAQFPQYKTLYEFVTYYINRLAVKT